VADRSPGPGEIRLKAAVCRTDLPSMASCPTQSFRLSPAMTWLAGSMRWVRRLRTYGSGSGSTFLGRQKPLGPAAINWAIPGMTIRRRASALGSSNPSDRR